MTIQFTDRSVHYSIHYSKVSDICIPQNASVFIYHVVTYEHSDDSESMWFKKFQIQRTCDLSGFLYNYLENLKLGKRVNETELRALTGALLAAFTAFFGSKQSLQIKKI